MSGFRLEDAAKRALQHAAEAANKKYRTLVQTLLEEDKIQEALWALMTYSPNHLVWTTFFGSLAEELEKLDDDTKIRLANHTAWDKLRAAFTILTERLIDEGVATQRAGVHYLITVAPVASSWALVEALSARDDWVIVLLALIKLYRLVKYGAVPSHILGKLHRMIPTLRERYKDRPEILRLLDDLAKEAC